MLGELKQKWRRLIKLLLLLLLMACSLGLIFYAFQTSMIFFYTPKHFLSLSPGQRAQEKLIRLGGLVKRGSFHGKFENKRFLLQDETHEISVHYQGSLPDLFREGQGVVVEGIWQEDRQQFQARKLFTKHDETYMPRELVQSLKEKGRWQHSPTSPQK
ncbi:MAG: cytochrome c maturation protein CcmE [Alphaproteobacteria bacterium]